MVGVSSMTMFAALCLCTNQHTTDAATVWRCGAVAVHICGAGVAQPSKLKQQALAHISTSVLCTLPCQ